MSFRKISICLLLGIMGCQDILIHKNMNDNVADFNEAWEYIELTYPSKMFEYKGIDWNMVRSEYIVKANNANADEILPLLADLVAALKDGHARIYTEGGASIRPYTPKRLLKDEGSYDPELVHTYMLSKPRVIGNDSFEFGFLQNNLGYLRISTFGNTIAASGDTMDDIVYFFANTSGMILDLRNNRGGSSFVYDQILARLIDKTISTEYAVSNTQTREPYEIKPAGKNGQYLKPIVILINGTCFSGTEVFVDRLSYQSHVTLIGDTTAGAGIGSGVIDPRHYLQSGKSIKINYEIIFRKDSVPIEVNGVVPDILIPQTKKEIELGKDIQLESAIQILSK